MICGVMMSGVICAALRDLDPKVGGAEMSLSTLLEGIIEPGPTSNNAPNYIPFVNTNDDNFEEGWELTIMQSSDRGEPKWSHLNTNIQRKIVDLPVEDIWSGLAWKFRNRKSGIRNKTLYRKHITHKNKQFEKWVSNELSILKEKCIKEDKALIGITQLTWSIGACNAFRNLGVPYAIFVRDNIQITNVELYRESLENADVVIGAGVGLIKQLNEIFDLRSTEVVHLPINYSSRFTSLENIEKSINLAKEKRKKEGSDSIPRLGIMGIVPEKGHEIYKNLLPHLEKMWPELEIHIFGESFYIDSLKGLGNTIFHGNTNPKDAFPMIDMHMLLVTSLGTWGRVINEAGIFKIPTLSIDIGSQKEAVGNGGVIVENDANLNEITDKLKLLYEKRIFFGESAQNHAKIVDHRKAIAELRTIIHKIKDNIYE